MHCDYVRNKRKTMKFLKNFKMDLTSIDKNITSLQSTTMPREFSMWLHFHKLKQDCQEIAKDKKLYKTKRTISNSNLKKNQLSKES